ncbi:capsule assembly Wzi family protein [Parashewanella curva]|uniref:Capsule assembly Wzi family protein n=1 Tax=Parashewanella curva TaxID=2338552 RepID=A0A3L8PZH4_9GAMM|nr:capsule assembly Wzi family protein [Parashewanella curva]RLV60807.1 capsule assembly Wzi family protein [Parashewanella curva]
MRSRFKLVFTLVCILSAQLFSLSAKAALWIDTSDAYLRADIQQLADAGFIKVPVNTYPLMWSGVAQDLAKVATDQVPENLMPAFLRVQAKYKSSQQRNAKLRAGVSSDKPMFRNFGHALRAKNELGGSYSDSAGSFYYQLSATIADSPNDDKNIRFDDSYVATTLGNWVLSAGTISQWWGPSFDTALIKSNNARPMPSLLLTRNNPQAFDLPVLNWLGPWNLTAGFSKYESERFAPDALLWNLRGSIRPFDKLEIGFSWTTQFCGKGQNCSAKIWLKSITGQDDCSNDTAGDGSGCSKEGNQMAGFDIRYNDVWFGQPIGIYGEKGCEDSSGNLPWQIADCGYIYGFDTRVHVQDIPVKLFTEYTTTKVACGSDPHVFNCFYEHSTYLNGSRYYKRSLGSTYDSDARAFSLGGMAQFGDKRMTTRVRYVKLNDDGKSPGIKWTPNIPKQDVWQFETNYEMPMFEGLMNFGGTFSHIKKPDADSDSKLRFFANYEYSF